MTHGELLSQWASLGRSIRVDPPAVDWTPALRMIAAAEKDAEESRNVLKGLFERSKAEHFPEFGDPLDLDLDFGAHRWLKGSREEAWSDWLAWILEQKVDGGQVLELFRLDPLLGAGTTCKAKREVCTPDGRLDMVVRFGAKTLVVEIKTISEVREEQWVNYSAWRKRQDDPFEFVLLLAVDEPDSLPSSRKNTTGRKHGSASEFRGVLARLGRCIFTSSAMMMNRPY